MKNILRGAAVVVASATIVACGTGDSIEQGSAKAITVEIDDTSPVETTAVSAPETTLQRSTTTEYPGPRNWDHCDTEGDTATNVSGVDLVCTSDFSGRLVWMIEPLTPATTTTEVAKAGTRDNPFFGIGLSLGDWAPLSIGPVELIDFATIEAANRFNDPPPEGQVYARTAISATYNGTSTGTGYELAFSLGLAGAKGKVYDAEFISDSEGSLASITEQPDVIVGGTIIGHIYYLVDADDIDLLTVFDGSEGLQFVRGA